MKHTDTLQSPSLRPLRHHLRPNLTTPPPEETPLDLGLPKQRLLLTIPETARYLQVSPTTVRNLIDCGALHAGHVGYSANPQRQRLRITRQSMERLQKERFGT